MKTYSMIKISILAYFLMASSNLSNAAEEFELDREGQSELGGSIQKFDIKVLHPKPDDVCTEILGNCLVVLKATAVNVPEMNNDKDKPICVCYGSNENSSVRCFHSLLNRETFLDNLSSQKTTFEFWAASTASWDKLICVPDPKEFMGSITVTIDLKDSRECKFGSLPCMTRAQEKRWCSSSEMFRFYLYPLNTGDKMIYNNMSDQAHELFTVLRHHPKRTDNASEACLFIPFVDSLCVTNMCFWRHQQLTKYLWDLKYWNNGKDHLLFHFGDHEPEGNIGYALRALSSYGPSFDKSHFQRLNPNMEIPSLPLLREDFDIAIPLAFYRCRHPSFAHMKRFTNYTTDELVKRKRAILLSFRGMRYSVGEDHPSYVRNMLQDLHNGEDVIIAALCEQWSVHCRTGKPEELVTMKGPQCDQAREIASHFSFDDLMLQSVFSLVVPGEGTHCYRVLEIMSAGSVPVLLGHSARPFHSYLDWDSFSIIWTDTSFNGLKKLENYLRSIPKDKTYELQRNAHKVFLTHFWSLELHMDTIFDLASDRFRKTLEGGIMGENKQASNAWSKYVHLLAENFQLSTLLSTEGLIQIKTLITDEINILMDYGGMALEILPDKDKVELLNEILRRNGHIKARVGIGGTLALLGALELEPKQQLEKINKLFPNLTDKKSTELFNETRLKMQEARANLLRKANHYSQVNKFKEATHLLFHWAGFLSSNTSASYCGQVSESSYACYPVISDSGVRKLEHRSLLVGRVLYVASLLYYLDGDVRSSQTLSQLAMAISLLRTHHEHQELQLPSKQLISWISRCTQAARSIVANNGILKLFRYDLIGKGTFDEWDRLSGTGVRYSYYERTIAGLLWAPSETEKRLPTGLINGCGPVVIYQNSSVTTTRSSVTTTPHKNIPGSYEESHPNKSTDKTKIGIVTLCQYDASITPLTAYSFTNKLDYCEHNDIECFLHTKSPISSRPPAWGKVALMERHLGEVDWLVWIDCDSFFMNHSIDLRNVIANAVEMSEFDSHVNFISSEDALMLNTGIFAIRNCEWSKNLLSKWSNAGLLYDLDSEESPYVFHGFWEQAEFLHALILGPYSLDIRTHATFVPQVAINSYPEELASMIRDATGHSLHSFYTNGDFIISFSGCRPLISQEWCNTQFQKYYMRRVS